MKVICLYGRSNSGKTSTLKMLVEEIIVKNIGHIEDSSYDCLYTLKLTDGRLVCVTTSGDDLEVAESNADYVRKQNPDIWFTAMRTSGGSTNLFEFNKEEVFYCKKNALMTDIGLAQEEQEILRHEINLCDMKTLWHAFLI